MERLPRIDEHVRVVAAPPDRVWPALLAVVEGTFRALPGPLTSAWGLRQPARTGDWRRPVTGDTVAGFAVAEVDPPRVLTLRGRHRFARYELRFTLERAHPDRVELHARTCAEFPGLRGGVYRALVIGTGGHALVVGRLLGRIARRAERGA